MAMTYPLVGKKTVYIDGEEFGPEYVSTDGITVTVTPSTTDVESLDGTISVPNGGFEELSGTVNLIIPDIETLARVFPEATAKGKAGTQVKFGAGTCITPTPKKIVIHPTCDTDSTNDVYIPQALVLVGGEFTFSGDPTVIELGFTPLKTPEGYVIMGVGDLEHPSLYNPETMQYEPIKSPVESVAIKAQDGEANPPATLAVGAADVTVKAVVTREDKTTEAVTEGITWKSSTPETATITDEGVIHAVKAGKTNITATVDGIESDALEFTVTAPAGN